MSVRLRLQRFGAKKRPFYRLVAADQRSPRDGRFNELLGVYDPLAKPNVIDFKLDRIDYWVGVGAQPTDTVAKLIERARNSDGVTMKQYVENNRKGLQDRREAARAAKDVPPPQPKAAAAAAEE